MSQTEKITRAVPGVELFFGESVAQYIADISEQAYYAESDAEGFLLGKRYSDAQGEYVVVSGVTQDASKSRNAVGWFRSTSNVTGVGADDVRTITSLFGYTKVYVILADYAQESLSMYSVENGVARKTSSVMVENL